MKPTILILCLASLACAKQETKPSPEKAVAASSKNPVNAEITTEYGTIHCKLFPEKAPETVASFVGLARGEKEFRDPKTGQMVKRKFYDGLLFHRVIPEFMIQGGDPLSIDRDHPALGTGGPGFTLPDELSPDLRFDKGGMLAMANQGPKTHSAGSQFFITESPVPRLDGGYAIFGECGNLDVVRAIARVPRDGDDKPVKPVTMEVKIVE